MSEQRKAASCEGDTSTNVAMKQKYQREMVDLCSNEPDNGKITLEFNDMCTDVIDMIFCKMQLEDLVNISDTSTRLRVIARSVFSRKYAHRLMLLDVFQYMDWDDFEACERERALSEQKDTIVRTCDVKIWFKLMRNFGAYIKHVRILSYGCKMNFALLEQVFDYCSDSLETLALDGYRMLSVRNPLTKLQEFSFHQGFHAKRFESPEVLELMPNVRTLKLGTIPLTMAKSYAKVERIELQVENDEEVQTFISFILLNRQIKYLSLCIAFNCKHNHLIYSSIADNLGQLTTLKLFVCNRTQRYAEYRFKTVELFVLVTTDMPYPGNMFQFDDLKKIALGGTSSRLPFGLNFAERNKKVKILKLDYLPDLLLDAVVFRDFVKDLPELEQFIVPRINERIKSTLMNHLGSDWEPFEKKTCNFKIDRRRLYRFRKIISKTCA